MDSMHKPILDLLRNRRELTRPPFWFMRQAGRYLPEYRAIRKSVPDFLTLCYSPDLAAEVTLQPIRRFQPDAAIIFADILLIPDALGQGVSYVEGSGPKLSPVLRSAADVGRLEADGLLDHLSPVFESLRRVRTPLPPETALIGFAGAPWTVAVYMVEGGSSTQFMAARRWAASEPREFGRLIRLLIDTTVDYLLQQVNAGAEILQIFDTWSGLLSPPAFRRWCVEPVGEIIARIKERHSDIPIIAFPRGAGAMMAGYAVETGADGVSLDTTVEPVWAAANLGGNTVLQGNLDPAILVVGGEALAGETERLLNEFSPFPHIFNLGHGIVPETPPENVAYVAERVRAWKRPAR
ncbi:MAG: uroporphyrinogen decarboxylase [Proteobacteria bacterium]|nr:uroporphyrinogen decarboxylase [Pseudomonadota bacterium]